MAETEREDGTSMRSKQKQQGALQEIRGTITRTFMKEDWKCDLKALNNSSCPVDHGEYVEK